MQAVSSVRSGISLDNFMFKTRIILLKKGCCYRRATAGTFVQDLGRFLLLIYYTINHYRISYFGFFGVFFPLLQMSSTGQIKGKTVIEQLDTKVERKSGKKCEKICGTYKVILSNFFKLFQARCTYRRTTASVIFCTALSYNMNCTRNPKIDTKTHLRQECFYEPSNFVTTETSKQRVRQIVIICSFVWLRKQSNQSKFMLLLGQHSMHKINLLSRNSWFLGNILIISVLYRKRPCYLPGFLISRIQ